MMAVLDVIGELAIGVNLDPSSLQDLEAETPEGEAILDDLCSGLEFPSWVSSRSKHRLFQAHACVAFLKITSTQVECRTGRHQSVLPPSVIADTHYRWVVSPFDVKPPP